MSEFDKQLRKVKTERSFIAALDQSGGSTPKALHLYGIEPDAWSNDAEMFEIMHRMRARIMTSPAFDGDRVLGAILFEDTMDREVAGRPTAEYLWQVKRVVPFLKVDRGLVEQREGVQLMKPIPGLVALLDKAKTKQIFGTKMRSVIQRADVDGIAAIVRQQFEFGGQILAAGLVPIVEPEIDIHCPDKARAEELLEDKLLEALDELNPDEKVMLKLTLPEEDDFYRGCIAHPNVLKVVALSGGYSRSEANERLARQHGMVASFSRALTEGLTVDQSDEQFNRALDEAIGSIYAASQS
ncbi:MAG TPA: fructose bisphosphate aldolase [Candidatus Polarisedimenticolaceae bacterium]|nr:fructose bisphosphate aldolase [Candidatus Polarisedimenticolaceae bacterium]